MSWDKPVWLLALWLVPVVVLLYLRSWWKIDALTKLLVDDSMARTLLPRKGRTRIFYKTVFLTLSLTLLVCALAGPRFGVYFEKVSRKGTDLMILLDTSRSMLAEDIIPNRLASAKLDIEDLLGRVVGDRVGLIAFSGKPVIQVPLTNDAVFFRERLKDVDTTTAPRGGTAIGDAIRLGLRSLPEETGRDKAMILITDGEDHDSMPLDAARDAAARGIRVYTVALGDFNEGARIPVFDKNGKRTGWEKYQGQEVWSKPDTGLLKEIASITNGTYIPAGTASYDLGGMYVSQLENLQRGDYSTAPKRLLHEQYQIFLFLGMFMLLAFYLISPYRSGPGYLESMKTRNNTSNPTVMLIAFFLLAFSGVTYAEEPVASVPAETLQNNESIQNNEINPEEKTEQTNEIPSKTLSAIERYNEACLYVEQGKKEEAIDIFKSLLSERDLSLLARVRFNLGTLLAQQIMTRPEDVPVVEPATEPTTMPASEPAMNPEAAGQQSVLEQYRKSRLERMAKQEAIAAEVSEAAEYLQEASQNPKFREEGKQNLDVLKSWLATRRQVWNEEERAARGPLSLPEHLLWLQDESRLADQKILELPMEETQIGYQLMHDQGAELKNYSGDFADMQEKLTAVLNQSNETPDGSVPEPQREEAEKAMQTILQGAGEKMAQSADAFQNFDKLEGVSRLRESVSDMNAAASLMIPYPELVQNAVKFQEEIVQPFSGSGEQNEKNEGASPLQNRDERVKLGWESGFVRFWNRLMMQHAEARLAEEEEAESPTLLSDSPAEQSATAPSNASPEPEVNSPQETITTDSAEDPATIEAGTQKSPEEKILESMRLAKSLGPEIENILKELPEQLTADSNPDTDKMIVDQENRVLELLREIAKPLQDEQQNQNQQNQQQNQQNQQQQQNEQNQQEQNQDSQNDEEQSSQENESKQNEQQNEQQSEQQNKQEQNKPKEASEKEEQKAEEEKNQDEDKPSDKAEAMMRQVRKRQQDAKETREAIERFLRQNDKVDKNW